MIKMLLIIAICWWLLGVCGYFMMRQGSLVEFERCLGKKVAWGGIDIVLGLLYTFLGPLAILQALKMSGKNCFRKRNTREF